MSMPLSSRRGTRKGKCPLDCSQAGRLFDGNWLIMGGTGNFERGGSLKVVVTTHLNPGYYWKNGMPYTGNAVLTEYFRVMKLHSSQWIRFTQIVDDPDYLTQPFIVNYQFKKLPDGSKWNPTLCSVR